MPMIFALGLSSRLLAAISPSGASQDLLDENRPPFRLVL
jgi:hypothetical protein